MADDKARSRRALDALNFCNAGIQTGLGPFMSVFYSSERHWNPGQIGLLIACQSLAGIAVQSLTGHLLDESRHKKLLTGAAALVVALCAVGIALLKSFPAQIAVQLIIGLAITVFPAATAAFALGLSDEKEVTGRVARNESFTHFGNAFFAIAAGLVGALIALAGIFYAAAVFAAGMAVSVFFIEQEKVNYEAAREGQGEQGDSNRKGWRDLIRDHRILIFTAAVVLFNISNQATLPLVAQLLSKNKHGRSAAWQIAAAVFVAEAVMILIAIFAGKKADQWGRKPLFLTAFGFLALRNGLSVASHNPFFLISLQAFDGVAAAIYGVLLTLITADLAKGTGRFNFLQGSIQSAMGLGGFLSNLGFGALAKAAGLTRVFSDSLPQPWRAACFINSECPKRASEARLRTLRQMFNCYRAAAGAGNKQGPRACLLSGMYHHIKKLMYTVHVDSPDPRFGNMLLEQFGGANGELAAAMQYSIQGLNCEDPARKDLLMDIGTEELSHLEVVGTLARLHLKPMKKSRNAGEADPLIAIAGGGGVGLLNSMGNPWTADYLKITGELDVDLRSNIAAEARAKIVYERLINFTDDKGTIDALQFLMTREITHMKAFMLALDSMNKDPLEIGKIPPSSDLVNQYFNDSTGKGDYGDDDERGPWNQGGDWVFVNAPAFQELENAKEGTRTSNGASGQEELVSPGKSRRK